MLELQGIPVSPGVAIGPALVFDREGYRIARNWNFAEDSGAECDRIRKAMAAASERLEQRQAMATEQLGPKTGNIFAAQLQVLNDVQLTRELNRMVCDHGFSAELAVSEVLSGYAAAFRNSGASFLMERAADIHDIEKLLLEQLGDGPPTSMFQLAHPAIIASHDLTPGEAAELNPANVLGFCTETGGPGGHTTIVARGLEIPAVVGIGPFLQQLRSDDAIIIDGYRGRVILRPDEATRHQYFEFQRKRRQMVSDLAPLRDLPATTKDGTAVEMLANVEVPTEIEGCASRGALGVGLYRTEFLYLRSANEPTEDEHYAAYRRLAAAFPGKPIVIRTLDLGADKMPIKRAGFGAGHQEPNPFLGLRSIRLSLRNPTLFRTQLRAILRAAAEGDIRIMFPMISTLDELRSARFILRSVADDLANEGLPHRDKVPVGMMVEVPAAVLMIEYFAREVDFISLGTNDLTQYTLAVDRTNEAVADLYQSCDPSVLRLIQRSIEVADSAGIGASVCGEMSSHPGYALLLLGLGVRTLSASPAAIPQVKKAIRAVTIEDCKAMAHRALQLATAREVEAFLQHQLAGHLPELYQTL